MEKIIIKKKFHLFNDYWNPKIIGSINDHDVKLAKVKGEFVWHNHDNEDELFLVILPKGVEHKPIAKKEVWLLLFEPNNIKHTGDVKTNLTVEKYDKI